MAAGLALASSLCYGVSNFIGPAISRDLPVYAVLIAGQLVAFCVSALVVVSAGEGSPGAATAGAAALAGVGNAAGLIAFYRAASFGPLSIVTPIASAAATMPVAVGVAHGEALGAARLAGIVLVLGGVAAAARRPGGATAQGAEDRRRAIVWALLSAAAFGVFLTFMAPAADGGVFWAVLLSRASLLVVLGGAAIALATAVRVPIGDVPRVAVPGVLLFAGTLCYSAATREGDLSVVSVLSSLFPVVTVGLAFAILGERLDRLQAAGVALALVGVVLVSMRA